MGKIIVVLYDVSSAQRVIDVAKTVYGLGYMHYVAVKAYGAAASSGVPEVNRLALKLGKSFAVLPSVKDLVDIYRPERIIVISREYGEPIAVDELASRICQEGTTLLILGGIDPAPGKDVAAIGEAVYIENTETRLGPVAEAGIVLAAARAACQDSRGAL